MGQNRMILERGSSYRSPAKEAETPAKNKVVGNASALTTSRRLFFQRALSGRGYLTFFGEITNLRGGLYSP